LSACDLEIQARLGGDEFAILLENIQEISDASRLQQELSLPLNLDGYEVFTTTASIGIALSTTDYNGGPPA